MKNSIAEQYFTPDIEDIRVGYECEHRFTDKQEWQKLVIKPTADIQYLKDICDGVIGGAGGLRTPYLTKEQIEAEGWEFVRITPNKIFIELNKDRWDLDYNVKTYTLKITDRPRNDCYECESGIVFEGECKDINTFRYICKLLGI